MNKHKYNPVDNENFYSNFYSEVSVLLNDFANERSKIIASSVNNVHQARLVKLCCQIFSVAIRIAGGPSVLAATGDFDEFKTLGSSLVETLHQSENHGFMIIGDEIDKHLKYLTSNVDEAEFRNYLLSFNDNTNVTGKQKSGNTSIYIFECLSNCIHVLASQLFNTYQWTSQDPRQVSFFYDIPEDDETITQQAKTILSAAKKLEGWCSPQKSALLYHLVRMNCPETLVEIGIYGGRSIVPMAAALRDNGSGHVYGIETWSGAAATAYRTNIANDFWWMNIDFNEIKRRFLEFILQHNLHDRVKIVESPSYKCHSIFDKIDMLHIDGGHSTFGAAQDVINYVSKVPSGGIIVYDDINWPSTSAGLEILRDTCRLLHTIPAFGSTTEPGCAAFIKI